MKYLIFLIALGTSNAWAKKPILVEFMRCHVDYRQDSSHNHNIKVYIEKSNKGRLGKNGYYLHEPFNTLIPVTVTELREGKIRIDQTSVVLTEDPGPFLIIDKKEKRVQNIEWRFPIEPPLAGLNDVFFADLECTISQINF